MKEIQLVILVALMGVLIACLPSSIGQDLLSDQLERLHQQNLRDVEGLEITQETQVWLDLLQEKKKE